MAELIFSVICQTSTAIMAGTKSTTQNPFQERTFLPSRQIRLARNRLTASFATSDG